MSSKFDKYNSKTEEFEVIDLDSQRFSGNDQRDIYSYSPEAAYKADEYNQQYQSNDIPVSKKRVQVRTNPYAQQQYNQPQQHYQQPVPEYYPPVQDKPKKKSKAFKRFVSLLVVIAIIAALPGALVFSVALTSDYTREDLERNEYISSSSLAKSPAVTNILLLGVDGSADSSSRSDSMILVSVDSKHGKIKLTSFLRDSWVYIPAKEKNSKLNSACSYGGPQAVVDTIEYNYEIDIDHYVMVDFDMFTQIIDSLGGVEVEVTENEASFINRTTSQTVESGKSVHLNGAEALVYCRIRKLDSDYMRTFRQRKVITALINQAKEAGFSALKDTVADVFPLIRTDMTSGEITAFAYKAGFAILAYDIVQTQAPIDEHFEADTISGQWVEVVDIDATKDYIYDFIYTNHIQNEEEE